MDKKKLLRWYLGAKKYILFIITLLLIIGAILITIENNKLNDQIDQQVEQFYSK